MRTRRTGQRTLRGRSVYGRELVQNTPGIEIDPNILDYQTRVAGEGGTLNNHGQLEALTIMYQEWVANSIRTDILRYNGWYSDEFAGFNVPLVYNDTDYTNPPIGNAIDTNNNLISSDFSFVNGIVGRPAGSTFLDTGFNPSTVAEVSQNNIGFFVNINDFDGVGATMYDIGASLDYIVSNNGGTDLSVEVSCGPVAPGITPELGFLWVGRNNGSDIEITLNGTHYTVSAASIGEAPFSLYVLALNVGVDFGHSNKRNSGYGITKYMTPDKRLVLRNSIVTANTTMGRI